MRMCKTTCVYCGTTTRNVRCCGVCKEVLMDLRRSRKALKPTESAAPAPLTQGDVAQFIDGIEAVPLVPHFGYRRRG